MGKQHEIYDPETGDVIMDEEGREVPDPVPLEPPIGYIEQESMFDIVRRAVHDEMVRKEVEAAGYGSFEEEDDFEVGDDFEPYSPHENDLDPSIEEMARAGEAELQKKTKVVKTPPATASGDEEPVRQDPQPEKTASSEEEGEA